MGKEKIFEIRDKNKSTQSPEKKPNYVLKLGQAGKKFRAAAQAIVMGSTLSNKILKGPAGHEKSAKMGSSDPQKILEPGKALERFENIKRMLKTRRVEMDSNAHEIDNLEKSEQVLEECRRYYEEKYGADLTEPSTQIMQLAEYDQVIAYQLKRNRLGGSNRDD